MKLNVSEFETLFKANYADLCLTAIRIVRDKDIAEDVVQEVFLQIWKKRDDLDFQISLKAYLHKSVINHSLNYHARQKSVLKREETYHQETALDVNDTEQKVFSQETQQRIDQVINSIPEACRRVFVLSRHENLSYKQIAETLDISVKTVENHITKALRILRTNLNMIILIFFFFST